MNGEKYVVKSPFLGFENVHEVTYAEIDDAAVAFLSMEDNAVLQLINPYKIREYSFEIPVGIQTLLDIKENSNLKVFCVFIKDKEGVYVNFLAPVVLNVDNKTVAQIALNAKDYPNFGVAEPIKNYIKE